MRFVPSFTTGFVCDSVSHLFLVATGEGMSLSFLAN